MTIPVWVLVWKGVENDDWDNLGVTASAQEARDWEAVGPGHIAEAFDLEVGGLPRPVEPQPTTNG